MNAPASPQILPPLVQHKPMTLEVPPQSFAIPAKWKMSVNKELLTPWKQYCLDLMINTMKIQTIWQCSITISIIRKLRGLHKHVPSSSEVFFFSRVDPRLPATNPHVPAVENHEWWHPSLRPHMPTGIHAIPLPVDPHMLSEKPGRVQYPVCLTHRKGPAKTNASVSWVKRCDYNDSVRKWQWNWKRFVRPRYNILFYLRVCMARVTSERTTRQVLQQ